MSGLDKYLDVLQSTNAIRLLKHRYMLECDLGYRPEKLGPMFADDAVWENIQLFGRHEGRRAIEEYFGGISSQIVFAAHLAMNDVIEVDGDVGTGKWRIYMPCTMRENGKNIARVIVGDYDERYVRVDGIWLFKSIDFFINYNVIQGESWSDIAAVRPV